MADDSIMDIRLLNQEEGVNERSNDVDSGDGDDSSSSSSDRSYEADDLDSGNGRGDSGSGGTQENCEIVRRRRKRRHGSHGSRRHKGGSRHKHKGFQPYPPKDEISLKRKSQELKEKENAAAHVRREGDSQQITTFPVAPFNSTQFLMEEHSAGSPAGQLKGQNASRPNTNSPQTVTLHSVPSTPAESNHECISFEKKDKEFSDFFTTIHAESLQSLPKEELVKHYMSLEEKVAALQKKVAEAEQQCQRHDDKEDRDADKDMMCSETSSLSSNNEEFVDLSVVRPNSRPTSVTGPASDEVHARTPVGAS